MADPTNKVGFPQAFGATPYQPVSQFSQYQNAPAGPAMTSTAPMQNGYSQPQPQMMGAPSFQPPQPPSFGNVPKVNGFVPPTSTFPAPNQPTQFQPGPPAPFPGPAPQSGPQQMIPAPQQPSAFKPYAEQRNAAPNTGPSPNGMPNQQAAPFPGPAPGQFNYSSAPVVAQQPQPMASQMPPAPAFPSVPSQPSAPVHQQPSMTAAAPRYPQAQTSQTGNMGASYPGPQGYGGTPATNTYGAPQQQQQQQMQQGFGQMNMSTGGQVPVSYGAGGADVIDLMSERNVLRHGFDNIPYQLPHSMANSDARVDPAVFRSTLNSVPQTEEVLKKSRLPFGLTVHPFRDMKNLNIIQTSTIVRCRYCRTYINPYVHIPDARRWRCNMCNRNNDLPDDFCWDPATKSFGEPVNRPEIRHATVEFIAPNEYMPVRKNLKGQNELRPPQAAVYVFILDISAAAVDAGYLYTLSEQLLINLDHLPGDDRTQVAFLAVDASVHFFQFSANSNRLPRQLVVDDINEMFLPATVNLLVSLKKNKEAVRAFVKQLPILFEHSNSTSNCLGSALSIAHEMIADIGGRISVFQATLPNLGPGALQPREDPNQRAAADVQNLGPATDFYKRLALECTGHQVAMDLFMFNTQYADIASLSEIAKFSTGCVYYFPNYHCLNESVQVKRFEKTLSRYLTRKIGFEAVLRIRCSRGLALSAFYGNFFVRSTDLLALANVNPDSAIAVQVNLEEKLGPVAAFQAALLYTSSKGDRRIRVHTMCLPTTTDLSQVYASFDLKAGVSLLAKLGVDRSMACAPLSDSREAMMNAVVDSLGAFQKTIGQGRGALLAPRAGHLRLFALYALAMLKHTSLAAGRSIRLDDRVAAMLMLRFAPLEQILSEIYPQLYRLNGIEQLPEGEWPVALPLSFEHVNRDGIYVMEAGSALYLYVSATADSAFLQNVFGCPYQNIDESSLPELPNPTSEKVRAFLKHLTTLKFYLGPLIVIREDSPLREVFVRRMVEDRTESTHSYIEFLQHVKREIAQ